MSNRDHPGSFRQREAVQDVAGGEGHVLTPIDGNVIALDARTGTHLWHYQTGGNHSASPISYAVDGRQYLALTAGNVLYSFALPE
jgi:outer membrane protein assembly factor BamB